MAFRPLPVLTVFAIAALAVLVSLGVWQLRRADEKRAMIAAYEAAAAAEAYGDIVTPFCRVASSAYAQRVLTPTTVLGDEVRFYGARAGDGAPGWRILRLTPAPDCACERSGERHCLRDDRSLVVEVGFETLNGERTGPSETVEIRLPPRTGAFTPQNDPVRGEFYRFDPDALADAFGVAPEMVDAGWQLAAYAPGLPPGLAAMPPARHIGYALTWFGLAATLIGVYFAYHYRLGRLGGRLGRRPQQPPGA